MDVINWEISLLEKALASVPIMTEERKMEVSHTIKATERRLEYLRTAKKVGE